MSDQEKAETKAKTPESSESRSGTVSSRFPPDGEGSRPGWLGVGAASLAAAAFGGLLGQGFGSQPETSANDASAELVDDFGAIVATQRVMEDRLLELQAITAELSASERVEAEGDGTASDDLSTFAEQIDTLTSRLEVLEIQAVNDVGPVIDPADLSPLPEAFAEEIVALNDRISRIEAADSAVEGIANPRVQNRTISELQERVQAMESAQLELVRLLEARNGAVETLVERVTAIEVDMKGADVGDPEMLADVEKLRSDLDRLMGREAAVMVEDAIGVDTVETAPAETDGVAPEMQPAETAPEPEDISAEPENDSVEPESVIEPPVLRADESSLDANAASAALGDIRKATSRGGRFRAAQSRLNKAWPGEPLVAELAPFAEIGAPSMDELREAFPAPPARDDDDRDDGWNWLREASGGFVGRPEAGADPLEAVALAAQDALDDGNLTAAVTALDRAPDGSLPEAYDDWLEDARRRVQLEDLLGQLEQRLASQAN